MSYINKSLSDNETIIKLFKLHWMVWIVPTILGLFGALALFGSTISPEDGGGTSTISIILLVVALYQVIQIKSQERGLTSKRVIRKDGLIARKTEEVRLSKVETVEVKQSVVQRMLGSGRVILTGTGVSEVILDGIDDPLSVKRTIESQLD